MSGQQIVTQTLIGRSGAVHFARIVGYAGVPIVQATIATISAQVRDKDNSVVTMEPTALVVSQVIFNGLVQNDARWFQDTIGYNFVWTCPAQALSMAGRNGRTDIKFTPVSGEVFVVPFDYFLVPVYIP